LGLLLPPLELKGLEEELDFDLVDLCVACLDEDIFPRGIQHRPAGHSRTQLGHVSHGFGSLRNGGIIPRAGHILHRASEDEVGLAERIDGEVPALVIQDVEIAVSPGGTGFGLWDECGEETSPRPPVPNPLPVPPENSGCICSPSKDCRPRCTRIHNNREFRRFWPRYKRSCKWGNCNGG